MSTCCLLCWCCLREIRLSIDKEWSGSLLPSNEWSTLILSLDEESLTVSVDSPLFNDPPPSSPPGETDRLWEHEVVELFIFSMSHTERYLEIELGPHGHFLVLTLNGVRNITGRVHISFEATRSEERWRGVARVPRTHLPPGPDWVINATAIHGVGASRRYHSATRLDGDKPDFHQVGVGLLCR